MSEPFDTRYPLLVENVAWSDVGSTKVADDPGGVATKTLGDALGWTGSDPAGFAAALAASVELGQEGGHVTTRWVQRAISVKSDLGALTGVQASLYARARALQPMISDLMATMQVLDPSLDQDDADATKQIVTDTITDLVAELGNPGNPRVARVDTLLEILTGLDTQSVGTPSAANVGGALGAMRTRWGLQRTNCNKLWQEQIVSNFATVVDTVMHNLRGPWRQSRSAFLPGTGSDVFLGPELVVLARDLTAASAQLQECRTMLRSVLIGDADQATIIVNPGGEQGRGSIPLADLLDWLDDFLTRAGPRMITSGGRDAIAGAFVPMASSLTDLVGSIADAGAAGTPVAFAATNGNQASTGPLPATWPPGMTAPRVTIAFTGLHTLMTGIVDRVAGITRSGVSVVKVSSEVHAERAKAVVEITGRGLDTVREVTLSRRGRVMVGLVTDVVDIGGRLQRATVQFDSRHISSSSIQSSEQWQLRLVDEQGQVDAETTVTVVKA